MKYTMRDFLKERFPNGTVGIEHEEIYWAIKEQLSNMGMEWTEDDRKAVSEIGENPSYYMDFTEEQLMRLDEIQDAAIEFCKTLIRFPDGYIQNKENEEIVDDLYTAQIWCQIAEYVSEFLDDNGFSVYFPTHAEVDDEAGTEYITDEWEG